MCGSNTSSQSTTPATPTEADRPTDVDFDLECHACGYNLRSLAWNSVCTECGRPVAESIPPDGFRFAGCRYAARTALGVRILLVAILLRALTPVVAVCHYFLWAWVGEWVLRAGLYAWIYSDPVIALVELAAVIAFQPPIGQGTRVRLIARIAIAAYALATVYRVALASIVFFNLSLPGVYAVAWFASRLDYVGLVLLLFLVTTTVDRRRRPTLWMLMVGVSVAATAGVATLIARELIWYETFEFVQFSASIDPGDWWRRAGLAVFWIIIAIWLTVYLRQLRAALRFSGNVRPVRSLAEYSGA